LESKLGRVRQTIGTNEQDFRQFVRVLEGTNQKWESEWKNFLDVGLIILQSGYRADENIACTRSGGGQISVDQGYNMGVCQCSISGLRRGR
jgi:hypothetical protein